MSLDLNEKNPVYLLGRIAGLATSYGVEIDDATLDVLTTRPLDGLGLLSRKMAQVNDALGEELSNGVAQILQSVGPDGMPRGPLKAEAQGPYYVGYYHQRHARRARMTPNDLVAAGQALYGERWQSDLARALNDINPRRVREWLERDSVPTWVAAEVYALLTRASRETARMAQQLIEKE